MVRLYNVDLGTSYLGLAYFEGDRNPRWALMLNLQGYYAGVKGECLDLDECAMRDVCNAGDVCINTPGSFRYYKNQQPTSKSNKTYVLYLKQDPLGLNQTL